jgi:nicotinamidase-related amidase
VSPDHSPARESVLLLIDFINHLEFEGGEELLAYALRAAERTAALKSRLSALGTPVIYVNDHFGEWRSDFRQVIERCTRDGVRGKPLVELLKPTPNDYFILKPRHSGFYLTPLDLLLESLQTRTLILTGLAADVCVLFTANDAYVRKFDLFVPKDCIASQDEERKQRALRYMEEVLKVNTAPSTEIHSHLA